jgi:phosphonate transport system ATP-binding protein
MALVDLDLATAGYNGATVLHEVSLSIERGEKVALVGRSGAGKSTLLRLIYERIDGEAAMVPQEHGLVRALTVFHNIYMGQLNRHSTWRNVVNLVRPMQQEVANVRGVVESLGLEDELFSAVGALSGGQQQRTAVGRALYQECDILLGDEPVSAVDEYQSRSILQNIAESKNTVILAMHDIDLALTYSDRLVGLDAGRIIMDESTVGMKASDLDHLYQG